MGYCTPEGHELFKALSLPAGMPIAELLPPILLANTF